MSKSNKNRDRREMVEQMRRQAKAAERRRTMTVVAVCVVVALIIVGLAGYKVYKDQQAKDEIAKTNLSEIGTAANAAGCEPIKEDTATGTGKHTPDPVTYDVTPPSYGPHNPTPDSSGKHLFTAADRPAVEVLVHNLEHGWTIVWYDKSVAADDTQMKQFQATADKFDTHGSDPAYNMIIAPWTSDDQGGGVIPDGKHIALTHWSIHQPKFDASVFQHASDAGTDIPSFGESEYCTQFSGEALADFMKKYPYDDAPEGNLWHQ